MKGTETGNRQTRYGITRRRLRELLPCLLLDDFSHTSEVNYRRVMHFTHCKLAKCETCPDPIDQAFIRHAVASHGPKAAVYALMNGLKVKGRLTRVNKFRLLRQLLSLRSEGWDLVNGQAFCSEDVEDYRQGMFDRQLSFIDDPSVRKLTEIILFMMLMCELRSEAYGLRPWTVSTRRLSERLGRGVSASYQQVGRALRRLTEREPDCRPIFLIVQKAEGRRAPRYSLNPLYANLACYLIGELERNGRTELA
jgi:hypothetical protein